MSNSSYQDELLANSWVRCWSNVFDVGPSTLIRDTLIWMYSEPCRAYHNVNHLIGCIDTLKKVYSLADNPQLIELALWYHDAVYNISERDNEIKSASLLKSHLFDYVKSRDKYKKYNIVEALILDTRHNKEPTTNDGKLICDIDLVTLGEFFFEAYCYKIRDEYAQIPNSIYYPERLIILEKFYDKPTIYYTEYFRKLYEDQARKNIEKEIKRLKDKIKSLKV